MVTVLTPTYNRGHLLVNAYDSLCKQKNQDFEWIIVDDGSIDNTEELVNTWIKEHIITIKYIKQDNGGKHRAVNRGMREANGELTLILDSDDFLTEDAISFIEEHQHEISDERFAGLSGLKGWIGKDTAIGNQVEDDSYIDSSNADRVKYGLLGDKAEVYKTSILRKYSFPEFSNEKFIRESAVWDRISLDGYILRWYMHTIYKANYLEDGITKKFNLDLYVNNFEGYVFCTKLAMKTMRFPYKQIRIGQFCEVSTKKGNSLAETTNIIHLSKLNLIFGQLIYKLRNVVKK